jgi:FixJ family two-component response regulator
MLQPQVQRPPLVLVVDDDAAVRTSLAFNLEMEGFDVATFGSGEALLLRDLPIDGACLVIDERLPGISGLDALSQLRRRNVALPAILVTSHPSAMFRAAASKAGVPIVEKPLIGDGLAAAIRAALAG